eukprot:gene1214-1324_t
MGLGILIMQILSYYGEPIPYTVVVFLLGAVFSLTDSKHGTFGKSVHEWVGINADLMLFVFLPPLIFGEAMYLNWYHVKGGLIQSIILAGPGVLIGAALMGVFAKFILPYNWAWNFAMMFGSILSATDPVAVVALLKSVGASPKLTILIVGESLLNDGSAMVLFTIFYNSVNGRFYNVGSVFGFMFAAALGSVALGVVIGLLAVRWLRSANRPLVETDVTIQIAVTICCAYLTFFLAQNVLEISGVLACCGAGAMLAWLAPPIILNHESMHNVWGMIEWCLNTVIFLLAGLIIGNRILVKVNPMDWAYLIAFYAALMVIRFITVFMLFPSISTIGHRCTVKEAVFMSWAGLRGALGMALALIVENTLPNDIKDETSRLFFFVGGIAALTLLLNATTAKGLLVHLGLLNTDSPEKALVTAQIKRKLQRKTDKFIQEMSKDFQFANVDVEEVRMSCTLLNDMNIPGLMRETECATDLLAAAMIISPQSSGQASVPNPLIKGAEEQLKGSFSFGSRRRASMGSRDQSHRSNRFSSSMAAAQKMNRLLSQSRAPNSLIMVDLLHYVRSIFLEIVRVKYWQFIESGKLPRQSFSAQFLLYTIDVGLDEIQLEGGARDWVCLEKDLDSESFMTRALKWYQNSMPASMTVWSSNMLGFQHSRDEKREVYMLSAFIEAHEHAQRKVHSFLGLGGGRTLEEGSQTSAHSHDDDDDANRNSGGDLPCPEELKVVAESRRAVEAAKDRLSNMNPSTIAAIRSKQAARLVLAKQAELVKNMVNEGLLTTQHAEIFLEEISEDTQRIEKERNRMYKQQMALRAQQMQSEKEERESALSQPRPSLLSFILGERTPKKKRMESLSITKEDESKLDTVTDHVEH